MTIIVGSFQEKRRLKTHLTEKGENKKSNGESDLCDLEQVT